MLNLYRPSFYLQLLFRVSQTDPKQNNFFLLVLACLLQFLFLTWSSTSQSKGKVHLGFGEGKKTPLLSIIKYILTLRSVQPFCFHLSFHISRINSPEKNCLISPVKIDTLAASKNLQACLDIYHNKIVLMSERSLYFSWGIFPIKFEPSRV